jgi:hypothetical protein
VCTARDSTRRVRPAPGDGTVGQPYRIQTSTSLAEGSWVDWPSFTYTGPVGFLDFSATGATNKFYRAVSP